MNNFADFKIKPKRESLSGEKIKVSKILNKEITVEKYKISPSKYEGMRLDMQLHFNNETRVVWTSSTYLIDLIQQIPEDGFPFITTIIEVDEHYEFT